MIPKIDFVLHFDCKAVCIHKFLYFNVKVSVNADIGVTSMQKEILEMHVGVISNFFSIIFFKPGERQ